MAKGSRADLGALVVPKAAAAAAVPHQPAPPVAPVAGSGERGVSSNLAETRPAGPDAPKALTVKLDGATYRRLRRFCRDREDATGKAPSHQEIMVAALLAYLPAER